VITRDEVMPLLLSACPSFGEPWRECVGQSWYDADLRYVHLGEFAHHLVDLEKARATSEFARVFAVVEDHTDGDGYVREAARSGLLEDIQNIALGDGVDLEAFLPFLRPESARWWHKLIAFWKEDRTALRD